jgi:chemotaxis protein CheC
MTTLALSPVGESVLTATFSRAMLRAGDALGAMSGQAIRVDVPEVRRCTPDELLEMAGGPGSIAFAVYLGITGSLSGHALLLLPLDGAHRLASVLLEGLLGPGQLPIDKLDPMAFDELEISVLAEAGNVTISAFLNEIGMHLHEPVMPTPPQTLVEMLGAVLDGVLLDLVSECDQLLATRTTFTENGHVLDGAMLVLPRAGSLQALLDALGIEQ